MFKKILKWLEGLFGEEPYRRSVHVDKNRGPSVDRLPPDNRRSPRPYDDYWVELERVAHESESKYD